MVKPGLVNNARMRWLAPQEEARLRTAIKARYPEHMPELELALNTGLRLSEMYGLTWENVNLSQRVLTIPRSNNGEMRYVPLNAIALAVLLDLRKRGDDTGRVILNVKGLPLSDPRHWFEPCVRDAKIQDFSWHCLRHNFTSRLVMAGVDLRTVQELLGHKSIAMTVRYSHLAPAHTLAAAERLARPNLKGSTDTRTSTSTTEQGQSGFSCLQ